MAKKKTTKKSSKIDYNAIIEKYNTMNVGQDRIYLSSEDKTGIRIVKFKTIDNYDEEIKKLYDKMYTGEKCFIGPNLRLTKGIAYGKGYEPKIFVEIISIREYEKDGKTQTYKAREPLSFYTKKDYDLLMKSLTEYKEIPKLIEAVSNVNKPIIEHNNILSKEKRKDRDDKKEEGE